ncbi:ABC transporter ATP-binding protein [Bosea sp. (in: a-proteobacteria)]|jgi:peptide/nickel transport system ATP-binding protein|uniref:ABC transporter ATP-binding protein n=1 Tax=Bosea sp. (in: a-proteobacteria) TaxID=1871050 RepID=UPI003F716EBE
MTPRPKLLEISGLSMAIRAGGRELPLVRHLDLELDRGEVLGLVGESGSGKSLSMLSVLGLLPKRAQVRGSVRLDGQELLGLPERAMQRIRGKKIGMIFQDPMTALDPVMTVGAQLVEAIHIHDRALAASGLRSRAIELLRQVAIADPEQRFDQYPHEFSGGMRQRVMIAIAIANDPDLLIADEPTTALDVTIQAQIVELLDRLRRERNLALVLITHDLGLVAGLADDVAIMYAGEIVERGPVREIFEGPRHPYTIGLMRAMPSHDGPLARLVPISGAPPSPAARPSGCAFHPRCPSAIPLCLATAPGPQRLGASMAMCHRAAETAGLAEPEHHAS